MTALKSLLPILPGIIALALAATAVAQTAIVAAKSSDLIQQGQYLATAGDCVACHTAPGGKPFAGGLSIATPVGNIIATNITPSKSVGIGNYTLEQFANAMRRGVRADGQQLYPAMPYTAYAKVTDNDVAALYAYFMQAVAPVDVPAPATSLPFPFNIRQSMAAWNVLFLDKAVFRSDLAQSATWNRGAYLARGLAHCGVCHTPRNVLMAEKRSYEFAGGDVGAWFAPNITSDVNSGVGGWSDQDLLDYLRLGHTVGKAQAAGPMAEAIDNSLMHLTDDDLHAIAVYLKAVPPLRDEADTRPVFAWGAAADDLASIRGVALPKDPNEMTGPQLYDAHCATCHQAQGEGSFDGGLPSLFHNAALGRTNTNNLVMVTLEGVHRQADFPAVIMPGAANELSDQQIATLNNYLIQRYGNPTATVAVEQVKSLRAGGTSSRLLLLARLGLAAVALLIVGGLVLGLRRRRTLGRS